MEFLIIGVKAELSNRSVSVVDDGHTNGPQSGERDERYAREIWRKHRDGEDAQKDRLEIKHFRSPQTCGDAASHDLAEHRRLRVFPFSEKAYDVGAGALLEVVNTLVVDGVCAA